ncbi:hypothetical protein [Streptomyces luteireticuli]|uniref:ABM domain-containing protein n=1 Tax=Streptomyces luteireticuli TaxID=173858 RepID=A0ABN0YKB7_9ACTN
MKAVIAWWDLAPSGRDAASLREFVRDEAVERFSRVRGLRLKVWISDGAAARWGAVLLWESAEAAEQTLPQRAAEIIGYPPTELHIFDVEACVEGVHPGGGLQDRGLVHGETDGAA